MNEDDFLKSFAKLLGPEANEALNKQIEAKKKERALLESFSASLSRVADFKIDVEDEPPPAPVILAKAIEPEVIVEAVVDVPVVEPIVEEITIPAEVPADDLITKAVTSISKATTQKDVQAAVDAIPDSFRKELDILKKSILDLHSFAKRQSQMGGGGAGDVINLDHQTTTIYTTPYIVGRKDYYIGVGVTPATITLPDIVKDGRYIIIKDEVGDCSYRPITVLGMVDNDPGGFILSEDYGGIQMIFNNGSWRII